MELNPSKTAYELASSLSDTSSLVEGALMLLDDAADRHDCDARYHAFRALIAEVQSRIAYAADAVEAISDAFPEQS